MDFGSLLSLLHTTSPLATQNKKKIKSLDYGSKLAGNVFQEFFLENDFIMKSGWLKFLGENTKEWIAKSETEKTLKLKARRTSYSGT